MLFISFPKINDVIKVLLNTKIRIFDPKKSRIHESKNPKVQESKMMTSRDSYIYQNLKSQTSNIQVKFEKLENSKIEAFIK